MIVGIPSEVKDDEYRVAITPAGVRELTSAGHTVLVEKGAGNGSSMPDADFAATGAKIMDDSDDLWAEADLVCKVKEPVAEEYHRLGARSDQILFTYLHLAASARLHRRARCGRQRGHRVRDGAPGGQLAAAACADERGGGADGAADGRAPPHATRGWARRAGVRCARRALRARS